MTWERHILEKIEACRSGSDDLASPEMADVVRMMAEDACLANHQQRVEEYDRSVRAALDRVPVPSGLETRLLQIVDQDGSSNPVSSSLPIETDLPDTRNSHSDQRRWRPIPIAIGLATAACLIIAGTILILQMMASQVWSIAQVKQEAIGWTEALEHIVWQDISTNPPATLEFPLGMRARPWQWCRLREPSPGMGDVIAYDLLGSPSRFGIQKGILFVFRADVTGLPATPPIRPAITQGRLIAAWHSGDRICVLVLRDANTAALQNFYKREFTGSVRSA
ncbi:MAG: hypothetical protein JW829_12920 [Pirellulales bacterium]|nr:hypothetical protein [Pirellulales bacterium]